MTIGVQELCVLKQGQAVSDEPTLMWDRVQGTLVVSKNGVWVKVKLDP